MNEACHTHDWVMLYIWMRHITHMNESCYTYECVMSNIWMSYITPLNESCHTYEEVTSHTRHRYKQVILHQWNSHITHISHISNTALSRTQYIVCNMTYIIHINQSYDTHLTHIKYSPLTNPITEPPPPLKKNKAKWSMMATHSNQQFMEVLKRRDLGVTKNFQVNMRKGGSWVGRCVCVR